MGVTARARVPRHAVMDTGMSICAAKHLMTCINFLPCYAIHRHAIEKSSKPFVSLSCCESAVSVISSPGLEILRSLNPPDLAVPT